MLIFQIDFEAGDVCTIFQRVLTPSHFMRLLGAERFSLHIYQCSHVHFTISDQHAVPGWGISKFVRKVTESVQVYIIIIVRRDGFHYGTSYLETCYLDSQRYKNRMRLHMYLRRADAVIKISLLRI